MKILGKPMAGGRLSPVRRQKQYEMLNVMKTASVRMTYTLQDSDRA